MGMSRIEGLESGGDSLEGGRTHSGNRPDEFPLLRSMLSRPTSVVDHGPMARRLYVVDERIGRLETGWIPVVGDRPSHRTAIDPARVRLTQHAMERRMERSSMRTHSALRCCCQTPKASFTACRRSGVPCRRRHSVASAMTGIRSVRGNKEIRSELYGNGCRGGSKRRSSKL